MKKDNTKEALVGISRNPSLKKLGNFPDILGKFGGIGLQEQFSYIG